MAVEVRSFAVTIPAGTAIATPYLADLTLPARVVQKIEIRIPPGPAGTVGFALGAAGQRVIPWGAAEWIIDDNRLIEWVLEQQITSGAWQLQGYNLGANDHTLYVTFLLDTVGASGAAAYPGPLVITQ